jgi:hypothetical protein
MRVPWRAELVRTVDDVIKQQIMTNWPNTPDDWSRPRQDMERLRNHITYLHPRPAPDRDDWNGGLSHGDPRFYVPRDLMLIDRCDLVVSLIGYNSLFGASEVGYAYARNRRIIGIDQDSIDQGYDGWRALCTSIFPDIEQCAKFLLFLVTDELHVPYTVPVKVEDRLEVPSH